MIIRCKKCGHKWETKSKLGILVCASCGSKNKNPNYKPKLKGIKNANK